MLKMVFKANGKVTCEGREAKDTFQMARMLKASGITDQPFECWRGDMKCLSYKSLYWAADHTIREEPCLHIKKYVPIDAEAFKATA